MRPRIVIRGLVYFYENLSRDLSLALNKKKGFSPTSLWYTKSFYNLYSPLFGNLRQDAEKSGDENLQQLAEDFEALFKIPWTIGWLYCNGR